jgi:arylsulfatase A-like enzyme
MSVDKPNLIFFIPDQWRGDVLGHLGNPAAMTPHLDRLVETDAVSFTNAFCQNPVCTPSRCSFMTGWYPHVMGHRTINYPLQAGEPCLLGELRKAGYHVWWGGKNDLVTDPFLYESVLDERPGKVKENHASLHTDQFWRPVIQGKKDTSFFAGRLDKKPGEEVYLDYDWANVLAAESFIRNYDGDKPFCLFLCLQYPHPPYGVEEPYFSAIDRAMLPSRIPGSSLQGKPRMHEALRDAFGLEGRPESWWQELRATYYGMCARVDAQAGRLLDALRQSTLFDQTAFFLFSDHGDFTGDYGLVEKAQNLFEDCLVRVPFILKPPSSAGKVSGKRNGLVELIDFPATVYELAGIRPGYSHFGRSLVPLLHSDTEHRDAVFCSGGRLENELHCREAESLEENSLYFPRVHIQTHDPVAHGKAIMCRDTRFKLVIRLYEDDEFYDLETDPEEIENRIHDPRLAHERERLDKRIRRFFLETCDVVPHQIFPRGVA